MTTICRAVLFDLDGTLLDTLDDLAEAANTMLRALGRPTHPRDAYRHFIGDGVEKLVERALPPEARGAATLAEGVRLTREHYAAHWADRTRPYAGIRRMLAELEGMGLALGVLSNKPHEFTVENVKHFFGDVPWRVVLGARPDRPNKPDPAGALEAAATLGLPPAAFAYLGDTATDMRTASAAGMYAIGAAWGFRDEAELRQNGARLVAHEPGQVVEALHSLSS